MSETKFDKIKCFAIYQVFEGMCPWCNKPLCFPGFHVDHVLPELPDDPGKQQENFDFYKVPSNFNINGYENLAPLHSQCNLWKGAETEKGSGLILRMLRMWEKNKDRAVRLEIRLNQEPEKTKLLTEVQAAIQRNLLNIQELQNFVLRSDIMEANDGELRQLKKELEETTDFEDKKMLHGFWNLVKSNTQDVIRSIARDVEWSYTTGSTCGNDKVETLNCGITNQIDNDFSVVFDISSQLSGR